MKKSSQMFTGTVKLKLCEAADLRPTDFHKKSFNFGNSDLLDTYVTVAVDDVQYHRWDCLRTWKTELK